MELGGARNVADGSGSRGGASMTVPDFELNVAALDMILTKLYGGSKARMSEGCGVGYRTLTSWFGGRNQPSACSLMKVSYATKVPVAYLMKKAGR